MCVCVCVCGSTYITSIITTVIIIIIIIIIIIVVVVMVSGCFFPFFLFLHKTREVGYSGWIDGWMEWMEWMDGWLSLNK